ncbi:hypothetical protein ACMZZG_25640, partial [Pseudocitrobacter faecalis]|uniref:hypothetical protein n=1 Tax=Pseudocitrobacter faecalis TaxID=1398493 RepID=UPI0039EF37ED
PPARCSRRYSRFGPRTRHRRVSSEHMSGLPRMASARGAADGMAPMLEQFGAGGTCRQPMPNDEMIWRR